MTTKRTARGIRMSEELWADLDYLAGAIEGGSTNALVEKMVAGAIEGASNYGLAIHAAYQMGLTHHECQEYATRCFARRR